jgi:hypothetical protein
MTAPGNFSLGVDGLLSAAHSIGLLPGRGGLLRVGGAIAAFTWAPLVVLAAIDHTLVSGPTVPLRYSFGTHARLLVAIPLFFFAESLFASRVSAILPQLVREQTVARADLPRFASAWRQAYRLWNSKIIEAGLIVVTLGSIYAGVRTDLPDGVRTWRTTADGHVSPAGWWYGLVSLPFFQFLLWRWAWRLLIWAQLLWRISRLNLRLLPTHPDLAGGLGTLGVAHVDLAPLSFACSGMIAASFAEKIMFGGATLAQFTVSISAIVVGLTVALILPLCCFFRRLVEVKQRGLLEYGRLATSYVQAFDGKWLRRGAPPGETILGTADLQSLADLGNSFDIIRSMRFVPMARSQIILVAVSTALPMLPLVLFAVPLDQVIVAGIKSLLGV